MELFPEKFSQKKAKSIQSYLARNVVKQKDFNELSSITGVDVSYADDVASVAFVTLRLLDFVELERLCVITKAGVSYKPGFLAFREGPPIIDAYGQLRQKPELFLFDGHGIAHPVRAGLATHMGIYFDTPAIGCAKEIFCGEYKPPAYLRGSYSGIRDEGELIGAALRTQNSLKPVFVSIGHRIDLGSAIQYTLFTCRQHRLPDPVRLAHQLSKSSLAGYLRNQESLSK